MIGSTIAKSAGAALLGVAAMMIAAPQAIARDTAQAAEAATAERDRATKDAAAPKRQGNNRGYVVGKGGVAREAPRGNSDGANPGSPRPVAADKAPIGVNEPGVNRRRPQ